MNWSDTPVLDMHCIYFLFYSESICNAFVPMPVWSKNIAIAAHMQCIYVQHASLELNDLFGYYIFIQQKTSICKAAKNICNECNKKNTYNAYIYVQHASFAESNFEFVSHFSCSHSCRCNWIELTGTVCFSYFTATQKVSNSDAKKCKKFLWELSPM